MKEKKMYAIIGAVFLAFVVLVVVFGTIFIGQIEKEPPTSSDDTVFIESVRDKKKDADIRFENLKSKLGTVLNLDEYLTNSITMGGAEYYEFNLSKEKMSNGEDPDFTLKLKDEIVFNASKTQKEVEELLSEDADYYDDTVTYYGDDIKITFSFEKDYEGHIGENSTICKFEIHNYSGENANEIKIGEKITQNSTVEEIIEAFGAPTKIVLSGYDTNNMAIIKLRYEKKYTNYVEFTVDCENGEITDIIAEIEKLSNGCDVVLATGYDENGSYLELVGYEDEDYTGVTTKIGIIKDDKWLIEPTTEFPFINNGKLLTNGESIFTIDFENNPNYIGNGCFEFDDIIYNCNNGKSFDIEKELGNKAYSKKDFGKADNNQRNNVLLLIYGSRLYTLNTSTMEYSMINENAVNIRAFNDGLFAAKFDIWGTYAFYNEKGDQVIDLSMYNLKKRNHGMLTQGDVTSNLVFSDGKCTFDIVNDKGSTYSITIDKTGNVLESTKIE